MTLVPDRGYSIGVSRLLVLAIAGLASACASVPDVESRLKSIQFHSNMYIARPGDSLASIAYRFDLSPAEVVALNPGIESLLYAGLGVNVRPDVSSQSVQTAANSAGPARPRRDGGKDRRATLPFSEGEGVRVTPAPTRAQAPVEALTTAPRAPAPTRERWRPEPLVPTDATLARAADADDRAAREWRAAEARQRLSEGRAPAGADPDLFANADPDVWRQEESWPREEVIADDFDDLLTANREAFEGSRTIARDIVEPVPAPPSVQWQWPTDGTLARGFDPGRAGRHGVDIAGAPGQDVRASLDGTVVYAGRDLSGGGNLVIVRHDDQLMTTYSHADKLFVTEDDQVRAGDPIASLGWNAESESVLRFEVRRDGSPLDPLAYLPAVQAR